MKAYVSEKASDELKAFLKGRGCSISEVFAHAKVHEAIACHPDVYYCMLPEGLYEGDPSKLSPDYPGDVLYNAAAVGTHFICSRYTDPGLIEEAKRQGLSPVIVPQGYVKCNLAVLDPNHIITEDDGIAKVLSSVEDIECLHIKAGEVALPGFKYGFIGGACGVIGNTVFFSGDLSSHSSFTKIMDFCSSCGLETKWFSSYPLTDIGSVYIVN